MGRFWSALSALATLCTVALVGYFFGKLPFQGKSLVEYQLNCLARGMHLDATFVDDPAESVRLEMARTILRRAKKDEAEICDVVEGALHLLAPGEYRLGQATFGLPGRKELIAGLTAKQPAMLANLKLLSDAGIKYDTVVEGCAIAAIRAPSASGSASTQTSKAVNAIKAKMVSVGRAKDRDGKPMGKAEFFCPVQAKS